MCASRSSGHYGRIDGSVHVPITQIPGTDELPVDQQLLVVCKVGGRSAQVTAFLQKGFDAINLAGGLVDWVAAGRPMVGDTEGDAWSSDGRRHTARWASIVDPRTSGRSPG